VTFSGEPDRKQAARVIGAITLNRISRNMDKWQGEVQFYCQPLK
jgi:phage-related protein